MTNTLSRRSSSDLPRALATIFLLVSMLGMLPAACGASLFGVGTVGTMLQGEALGALLFFAGYLFLALGIAQAWFYARRAAGFVTSARMWWLSTIIFNAIPCLVGAGAFIDNGSPEGLLAMFWFGTLATLAVIARGKESRAT